MERQSAPWGTMRSIFSTDTSKSVSPRTFPPPSSASVLGEVFGSSANAASPLVKMAYVEPLVGNPASGTQAMPCGVPDGGMAVNTAPVTTAGSCAITSARAGALDGRVIPEHSQASPVPSPSLSSCPGFGIVGQLSARQVFAGNPGFPNPSPSVSVQPSQTSPAPSPSVSVWTGFATAGQLSQASPTSS